MKNAKFISLSALKVEGLDWPGKKDYN